MIIFLLISSIAFANDNEEQKVEYSKSTTIDFEELEIEGTLTKPDSKLLLERQKAKFNPLINLRANWDEEMDKSVNDIK